MLEEDFQRNLEVLKANYASKLKEKVQELFSIEEKLFNTDYGDEALKELYIAAHRISGSSGMHGYTEVSEKAGMLEELLYPIVKNFDRNPTIDKNQIYSLLCKLIRVIGKEF
ncbi:MAG: Hpt domain-containing protein [Candidatus Gastranaerophilales bacterium]|nr:Hpt domain-containing protein [Candidatus Gastranaerophilales bacterium]